MLCMDSPPSTTAPGVVNRLLSGEPIRRILSHTSTAASVNGSAIMVLPGAGAGENSTSTYGVVNVSNASNATTAPPSVPRTILLHYTVLLPTML